MDLPLPVAAVARRARNAKSPKERHDTAYFAWEASVRLAVAARPPADASVLERASIGQWVAAAALGEEPLPGEGKPLPVPLRPQALPGEGKPLPVPLRPQALEEPALAALYARLSEVALGGRSAPRAVAPRRLLDALAAYRNQVIGHGATRGADFYEAGAEALSRALGPAWSAGVFWPAGARLLYVDSVEIDGSGARRARILDLTGVHASVEDPLGSKDAPADLLPGRLYLRDAAGGHRSLHPWLLYHEADLRERVLFFNGRGRSAMYLDYVSGEIVKGRALEQAFPAIERELLAALRGEGGGARGAAAAAAGGAEGTAAGGRPDAAAPADTDSAASENRFGDYQILGKLGAGGMGVVYLARQESLARVVALKVLPLGTAADPVQAARFRREIAALSRCDHPNVVKILASGERDGAPYYAMELVEGADLAQVSGALSSGADFDSAVSSAAGRVRKAKRELFEGVPDVAASAERPGALIPERPRERARRISTLLRDAARGLHHLHEHGIIHRDVKPGNLMITAADHRIVVMDLGLAAMSDSSRSLTRDRTSILGTLRYMAPEQLQRNLFDVDRRADVYALGATFYELFTGRPFLDGDTEARLLQQVVRDEPVPPEKAAPGLPADLATILKKSFEKDPRRRYESAEALAQDVDAYLEGRPIRARPPTLGYILSLTIRRNRRVSAVVAAALALLVLGGVLWERGRAEAHAREVRLREAAERDRARAEELSDFMLFDLSERLHAMGRLDVLDEAARKVKAYYDGLPDDGGNDALARKRGLALAAVAEVLASKGELEATERSIAPAVAIFRRLVAGRPDDAGLRAPLGRALLLQGEIARRRGDAGAATVLYREALAALEPPAGAPRIHDAQTIAMLVFARVNAARALDEAGDRRAALEGFAQARAQVESALREATHPGQFSLLLAEVDTKAAGAMAEGGDSRGAIAHLRSTRAVIDGLMEQAPDNLDTCFAAVAVRTRLADLEVEDGEIAEALATVRPAVAFAERLAARDPLNADWERGLATAHAVLGRAHEMHEELPSAIAEYRAASAISERVVARDPSSVISLREHCIDRDRLGGALLQSGRAAEALAIFRDVLATRERLAARDPESALPKLDMLPSYEDLGDALSKLGDFQGALDALRRGLALMDELERRGQGGAGVRRRRATLRASEGMVLLCLDRIDEGLAAFQDASSALEKLIAESPGYGRLRMDLAFVLGVEARHLQVLDRLEAARDAAARAVAATSFLGERAARLPSIRRTRALLRTLDVALGRAAPETPEEHLARGYALYEKHDAEGSAAAFVRALADPSLRTVAEGQHLYNGACAASVAAAAAATATATATPTAGTTATPTAGTATTSTVSLRWRAQSLEWLGAFLSRVRGRLVAIDRDIAAGGDAAVVEGLRTRRARLISDLEHARTRDPDLDAIRGSPEFARLFEGLPRSK